MRTAAFRVVAGLTAASFVVLGGLLFLAFFAYQRPGSEAPLPMGPLGHYFAAFAGCALIGWGGALWAGAREPSIGRRHGAVGERDAAQLDHRPAAQGAASTRARARVRSVAA